MIQINPEIEKKYVLLKSVEDSIIENNVDDIDAFIDSCLIIDEYIASIKLNCEEMEKTWQLKFEPCNSIAKRIRRKIQHVLFSSFIQQQNEFNSNMKIAITNISRLQEHIALELRKMEKKGE